MDFFFVSLPSQFSGFCGKQLFPQCYIIEHFFPKPKKYINLLCIIAATLLYYKVTYIPRGHIFKCEEEGANGYFLSEIEDFGIFGGLKFWPVFLRVARF